MQLFQDIEDIIGSVGIYKRQIDQKRQIHLDYLLDTFITNRICCENNVFYLKIVKFCQKIGKVISKVAIGKVETMNLMGSLT